MKREHILFTLVAVLALAVTAGMVAVVQADTVAPAASDTVDQATTDSGQGPISMRKGIEKFYTTDASY